jgi:hypothetical protein
MSRPNWSDCNTVKDLFVMVPSGFSGASSIGGLTLGTGNPGATVSNVLDHATVVFQDSNSIDASWAVTNLFTGPDISAVPNPWTSTNGANLCFQYVNGTKTTTPLWPWPMRERIKNATALSGSYAGPCVSCSGGRQARTVTDVQADVEGLLGPIPTQCKAG